MSPSAARVSSLLAVAPLTFSAFIVALAIWDDLVGGDAELRAACIAGSIAFCLPIVVLFRNSVRVRSRARRLTLFWTFVLGLHLVIFQPLWQPNSCALAEVLLMGQSMGMGGLWLIACAASWWGLRFVARRVEFKPIATGDRSMGPGTRRLVFGFALMPLLPGIFFILATALMDLTDADSQSASVVAYMVCAAIAVASWLLLWRRAVAWTPGQVRMTAVLGGLFLLSPLLLYLDDPLMSDWISTIIIVAPLLFFAAWLIGTSLLWRTDEPAFQLASSSPHVGGASSVHAVQMQELLRCPACEYLLKGLREVRCPECGWASTVDDLFARTLVRALPE